MCSPVLVLKEEPYALAVTGECFNKVCNGCLRMPENDNPLGRCSGCRILRYCNYDCAVKDWKRGHRYECGVFAEMRKEREKTSKDGCWQLAKIKKNCRLRLTARLLGCVAQNNGYPGTDAVCLTKTNMRCSFWSNEPASGLPHEEKYIEDLELFQQSYKLFSERFAKITDEKFLRIASYGSSVIAVYDDSLLTTDSNRCLAIAIYPNAQHIPSSCDPDLFCSFEKGVLKVWTSADCAASKEYHELRIGWVSMRFPLPVYYRTRHLFDRTGKICDCDRVCANEELNLRMRFSIRKLCHKCSNPLCFIVETKTVLCPTCKTSPTGSDVLPLIQGFMEFWKLFSTIDIQTFANEHLPLELVSQLIDKANVLHSVDNVILCKLRLDLAVAIADTPQDFGYSKRLNLAARLLAAACTTMDRYSCFKVTRIYWYMRLVQWYHTLANNEAKACYLSKAKQATNELIGENNATYEVIRNFVQQMES